jgi:hypothetical protein
MGYDIRFYDLALVEEAISDGLTLKNVCKYVDYSFETGMTYNFTRDKYNAFWNVKNAKNTAELLEQTEHALGMLANIGVFPGIPDGMDGWSDDMRVFASHIKRFSDYAMKYPNHIVQNDCFGVGLIL